MASLKSRIIKDNFCFGYESEKDATSLFVLCMNDSVSELNHFNINLIGATIITLKTAEQFSAQSY
jgi:hypothetical protein